MDFNGFNGQEDKNTNSFRCPSSIKLKYFTKFNYSASIANWIEFMPTPSIFTNLLYISFWLPTIFSNAFEESAQKAARSPSRRGKYLNLIVTPESLQTFYNSRTVVLFPLQYLIPQIIQVILI